MGFPGPIPIRYTTNSGLLTMIVIARRYGQLGNRLFLYAHLIAAARHYGVELRNPCFAEYANLFPSTRGDLWCRYDRHLPETTWAGPRSPRPLSRWRRNALMHSVQTVAKTMNFIGSHQRAATVIRLRPGEECDLESGRFRDAVETGRTLMLQGWLFRSGRLLNEQWSHIRDFFALSSIDQKAIRGVIQQSRRDSDLVVGVHIRRGDYANFQGGRFYFDDDQYSRWMHSVCEQYPQRRVRFLVCSHEALDETKFAGLNITRGPGSALQDMYALAETDWMMGPPSTFTAWAAFVGRRPRVELSSSEATPIAPVTTTAPAKPGTETVAA